MFVFLDLLTICLLSRWRSALLWRTFFTTAIVAVVLRAFIDICKSGKCGLFGKGGLIMFDVTSVDTAYHIVDLPPVILLGVIGGVLGSLYNYLLKKVLRFYSLVNEYDFVLAFTLLFIFSSHGIFSFALHMNRSSV